MNESPTLRYLTPPLLAITAGLAVTNWYFDPAKASWAIALGVTTLMALVAWFVPRATSKAEDANGSRRILREEVDSIRGAIVVGALIMTIALTQKFVTHLGLGDTALFEDLAQRWPMIVTGFFFVVTGNAMPKRLTPLAAVRSEDEAGKIQAFQRFTGWTLVLTGIALAIPWLTLPVAIARPVSLAFMFAGCLVVATATVRHSRRIARARASYPAK